MLSEQMNILLTSTQPGTQCGALLRHYWQPAALSVELEGERPVKAVTLLSEKLVLFRNSNGQLGLIERQCPHRGVDMAYGRCEDGGLRCPFHGWLFDTTGQCLEMPGEPVSSTMYKNVKTASYPCLERNGIIFAYMGPGNPPPLPDYDCFEAPQSHSFAFKGMMECNWLQALEVGIDPVHASFLHRYLMDAGSDDAYGLQFRATAARSEIPVTQVLRDYPRPDIKLEETDYGLRLITTRQLPDAACHVRVTNLVFPQAIVIPMSPAMVITQWHVPIDDTRSYWYSIFTDYQNPVDQQLMREQREKLYQLPDYKPKVGKHNNYGFSAHDQKHNTYTGMGDDINVHDQWAVESPGPIADRTKEHLATSDKAIIANRRLLRSAIKAVAEGECLPGLPNGRNLNLKGPVAVDTIGTIQNAGTIWRETDLERRAGSSWAKDPW